MVGAADIEIIIRPMQIADIVAVYEIERRTFTDPWARNAFVEGLGEEWSACFVAQSDGNPVGYVCAVGVADELHIHNLAVQAQFRGRGIGRRLLATVEDWARKREKLCVILDVRESNERARLLYASAGYEEIGRRKRYYKNPVEDALVLLKNLTAPVEPAER